MSGYLNKATLIGNLGRDPDVRTTQSGGKIVTLSIATSESWEDKRSGERVERTEWHRVVIFNEALADIAEQYLAKGAKVYVEGQIRTRKWQDQSGADRYSTEIHLTPFNGEIKFLDSRKSADRPSDGNGVAREPAMAGGGRAPGGGDLDDAIPFAVCRQ
jgi:single-strand DNA-binding protein